MNILVEYQYDAWGNIIETKTSTTHSAKAQRVVDSNRYFYRGYRYDEETNLYYLNSRYYNPVTHRFINADGLLGEQGNILGHNMYAYTQNNPVMYSDISGYFAITTLLIFAGVGALVGSAVGAYIGYKVTGEFCLEYTIAGAFTGALTFSGAYLAYTSIATASAMLMAEKQFTSTGIMLYLGINGTSSAIAQYHANQVNGTDPYRYIFGSFVGGVLGAGLNPLSPLIAATTSSMINEFERKLFFDYSNPGYSWRNVLENTKNYSVANYASYGIAWAGQFNPFTTIFSNYLSDLIVYILEEK